MNIEKLILSFIMKRSLFIISLLCVSLALWAQEESVGVKGAHPYKVAENEDVATEYAYWSIIPHVGFNVFDGDFNSEMAHSVFFPNAGLAVEYSFTPVWSLGVDYMFDRYGVEGKKGADNADMLLKGMMHQVGVYLSMDVVNLFFPHAHRKIVNIQPLVGAGHAWYKNTVMYDDASRGHTASYVWPDGTTGAKAMDGYQGAFSIRAGLNVEFNLNRTLALGIRAQYNYFVNDYIDNRGFSGMNSLASKNNDGIADVTLNMRFKLEAVKKTHVRNVVHELEAAKKNDESKYIHDTVIIRHDSIIVRETIREVMKEKEQQRVYYVYFQNNKSVLDEKALITIQQVADIMAEDTSVYAVVTGFCDNTGSAHLNYVLGDKRADAVIGELREEHAVGADHLYAMGMGKLVGHRSVAAYGPNRRAAIRLVDKATFDRMKSDLNDKRAQRDDPEEKEEVVPAQEEKTIPLSESARPEKVNIYKQRAAEEVTTDKTTTLSRLARQYYNNTYCWVYIYIANKEKINNPNALEPGTKLIIPELTQHEMEITKDESLVVYSNARSGK